MQKPCEKHAKNMRKICENVMIPFSASLQYETVNTWTFTLISSNYSFVKNVLFQSMVLATTNQPTNQQRKMIQFICYTN